MRILDALVEEHDLTHELVARSYAAGVSVFDFGNESSDEDSDDPERQLQDEVTALKSERNDLANLEAITQAAAAMLRYSEMSRDLERAKMSLEDSCGLR